jgi:CSLREA domain-containing protein
MHLNVKIFSDGVEVAQTVADTLRPDLAIAGVCTGGTCSFSVNLWDLISPDTDHLITVQAQDVQTGEWSNLYDTLRTLDCFTPKVQALIVNSTSDNADANPGDGVCETFEPGECTLRAAIVESNAKPGTDTINFDIPGPGPYTISPGYGFDFISDPVVIDGTTQPGFTGSPLIELNGSNAGPDAFGIVIFAGSSTVRGLVINRFALTGLDIDVNGNNTIQGNYIGTDLTGTVDLGNGVNGLAVSQGSGDNLIGGTTT